MKANQFVIVFLICFTSLFLTGATGVVMVMKEGDSSQEATLQSSQSTLNAKVIEVQPDNSNKLLGKANFELDKLFINEFIQKRGQVTKINLRPQKLKDFTSDKGKRYKSPNPVVLDYIDDKDGAPKRKDLNYIGRVYGLPEDILYAIMMKESKGNQYAISYKKAKGAFQFMYPTAVEFGLYENGIDYRTDPWRSADAAARYIKWLYMNLTPEKDPKQYKSYKYALAAYNAGIKRVFRGNDVVIPNIEETQDYVAKIVGYLEGDKYLVKKGDRLKTIAQKYNISSERLQALNNGVTNHSLQYGKFITVRDNFESQNKYIVKSGDTLRKISKLTNTDLYTIRKRNEIKGDTIYAGQTLYIP